MALRLLAVCALLVLWDIDHTLKSFGGNGFHVAEIEEGDIVASRHDFHRGPGGASRLGRR